MLEFIFWEDGRTRLEIIDCIPFEPSSIASRSCDFVVIGKDMHVSVTRDRIEPVAIYPIIGSETLIDSDNTTWSFFSEEGIFDFGEPNKCCGILAQDKHGSVIFRLNTSGMGMGYLEEVGPIYRVADDSFVAGVRTHKSAGVILFDKGKMKMRFPEKWGWVTNLCMRQNRALFLDAEPGCVQCVILDAADFNTDRSSYVRSRVRSSAGQDLEGPSWIRSGGENLYIMHDRQVMDLDIWPYRSTPG